MRTYDEMEQLGKRIEQYWLEREKTAQEALSEWIEARLHAVKKR